ncbi:hypothetical protein [Helicobacter cetorum]|uniref:Uncharacterized protein n=1 Tax=Helicobacter cetorum (strain ATCC BAA-429 / MIT 00-7128) TaxID=182217 RepID=I0ELB9_HELC0|nr:hypothetical protein [Helicobacter cetorum]AFI03738.1 hypothetical protein HCW_02285 [Helicobacter cetorum MIT 00-7128]
MSKTKKNTLPCRLSTKLSWLKRFIIKWRTRSLNSKLTTTIQILSILALASKANEDLEEQLKKIKIYIEKTLNSNIALDVYNRVLVLVSEYCANEEFFDKESAKISEIIVQDIQYYALVEEMLQEDKYQVQRTVLKGMVRREYDKRYILGSEGKILLEYQERSLEML